MRALVTGASGFLGAHLVDKLLNEGHQVAILLRSSSDRTRLKTVIDSVSVIEGDLSTLQQNKKQLQSFRPDTVFHCAWEGVANTCRQDSRHLAHNLPNSLALLRLAGEIGVQKWIGLGSQSEYGLENTARSENDPLFPADSYSQAKTQTLKLSLPIAQAFGMDFVWLRLFAIYGPGDNAHFMLPQLIHTLLAGKRPALTEGKQHWDYLYVKDAAEALVRCAEKRGMHGVFNLGSGVATPIRTLAERVRDLINPNLELGFGEITTSKGQVMHLQANIDKLHQAVGWLPRTTLETGLKSTIESFIDAPKPLASSITH